MITQQQVNTLVGRHVDDRHGDKVGTVGEVWADASGAPAWISVKTGLFGMRQSMVPLGGAEMRGDRLVVPFDKARIKDAPHVDASHDVPLADEDVDRLHRHYGVMESRRGYRAGAAETEAAYARRPETDSMTRSEERLRVGTEREPVGTARLRKYVVTEQQRVDVPVSHEEARIERRPVDPNAGHPDIGEEERRMTLHADRPVVDTESVPVEQVRLDKETVTDRRTVGGPVRKERVESDLPDEGRHDIR